MAAFQVPRDRWTFFARLGKKFFSVLWYGVGYRSVYKWILNFPIVLAFAERLCEFDFKKSCGRTSDFEELRFVLGINTLNARLAFMLNNVCVLSLSLGKGNEVLIDVRLGLISLAPNKQYIFICIKQHSYFVNNR